jgi:UDP-2,3-diacylglucosamine hydrolase
MSNVQYPWRSRVSTALIVSDAHLGHAPPDITAAFHRFLARVPDLADHLVINGDLFDFWFEYRTVIPRRCFPTLAALLRLRQAGVALTVTGGNHDRWGGDFWRGELDADFHRAEAVLTLAGWRCYVTHGDGLADRHAAARILHAITRRPIVARLFRWVHPDIGFPMVGALSGPLGDTTRDPAVLEEAARRQATFARAHLAHHPDVDAVILGHTHRPALEQVNGRRWYLNPGAWMDGLRYAAVMADGPVLHQFNDP